MSDTPIMDSAWRKYGPCADVYSMTHILRVGEDVERRLAAVTAERDMLRDAAERLSKAAENMMLYWQTGNGVTVERATIRHDDPIVDALRAALRRP